MSQLAKLSLSTKDVIHIEGFQENASLFKNESTLRIRTILQQLQKACTESGMGLAEVNALMEQGIPCEVLQSGAPDWQMGHIRLSLEFQPGLQSSAPMASTLTMQSNVPASASNSVAENPVVENLIAAEPIAAVSATPAIDPSDFTNLSENPQENSGQSDLESDLDMDFGSDFGSNLSDEMDSLDTMNGLEMSDMNNSDMNHHAMPSQDDSSEMDAGLLDDLDDPFGSELNLQGLGEEDNGLGMMPDARLEESVNTDLDLSDLSDMDNLSDGLGSDDLSFDMDSQAVEANDLGDLDSPWDLGEDLDEMLLKNSSL